MREVRLRDEGRNGAVRYLRVGVGSSHDAVNVADHDRLDLQRAEFAVTAFGMIVSVGFDLNKRGQKQWMHNLILVCVIFLGFTARIANSRLPFAQGYSSQIEPRRIDMSAQSSSSHARGDLAYRIQPRL